MSKLIRILSIDGGGIRGIIPARVLVALEQRLKALSGDANARIADFFDLIAGTSTGGILTCIYLLPEEHGDRPRYNAEDAVDLYLSHGEKIFNLTWMQRLRSVAGLADEKYPAAGLESLLTEYFQDRYLSELVSPCLITGYDIRRRRAFFFTQHDARRTPSRDFLVREAARATSAAPTYFEVANIHSKTNISYPIIDGGVFANNPTLCAYAEARKLFQVRAADMAILSLGTGTHLEPFPYEEAKDWGAITWMKPLIDIMTSGVAETVDYECRMAFDAMGVPQQYLRINIEMNALPPGTSRDLDDASPRNLQGLAELGTEAAERHNDELERFAELLIEQG